MTHKNHQADKLKEDHNQLIINYLTLRRLLGILGIGLPIVLFFYSCILKGGMVEISVSHYYFTPMREFLTGELCAFALFLLCYNGYKKADGIASSIAGIAALGVAFCHTTLKTPDTECHLGSLPIREIIHLTSAGVFFITLALMSIFLFTLDAGNKTKQKRIRNHIYRICGWGMIACTVLMILYLGISSLRISLCGYKPVFYLETVGLVLFGISWLIKGETLFKDKAP